MELSDRWTLATGQEDGKTLIYRIRLQAPTFATKQTFPKFLAVLWEYESPNEELLPSTADLNRMTQLEDLLREALEGAQQGFLSVIVTGQGIREWQWYVCDQKVAMELVNAALGALEPFPVQFCFQDDDPEWMAYGQFLAITGSRHSTE